MEQEKRKLSRKTDGFQVIEYIRSSIEIIMNLKVEDLEREVLQRNYQNNRGRNLNDDNHNGEEDSLNSSMLS